MGEVVAVIGGGIGDFASFKQADIRVALGNSSTDMVKDAADFILLDDDFSTLVHGIEESRLLFENVKKAVAFTLTSQWSRMLPYIGLIAFQFPLPISAATLLYISLVTSLIPAIAFAS